MILSLNYKSPILKLDMYLCKFEVVRSLKNATNSINSLFGRKILECFQVKRLIIENKQHIHDPVYHN